jgi:hypothetical protein
VVRLTDLKYPEMGYGKDHLKLVKRKLIKIHKEDLIISGQKLHHIIITFIKPMKLKLAEILGHTRKIKLS